MRRPVVGLSLLLVLLSALIFSGCSNKKEIELLNERIKSLESDYAKLKEQHAAEVISLEGRNAEVLKRMDGERAALQHRIAALEKELAENKEKAASLEANNKNKDDELNTVKGETMDFRQELADQQALNAELSQKLSLTQDDFKNLQAHNAAILSANDQIELRLRQIANEAAECMNRNLMLSRTAEETRARAEDAENRLKQTKTEYETALGAALKQNGSLGRQVDSLRENVGNLRQHLQAMESDARNLKSEIAAITAECGRKEAELQASRENKAVLEKQLADLQAAMDRLDSNLAKCRKQTEDLELRVVTLIQEKSKLTATLESALSKSRELAVGRDEMQQGFQADRALVSRQITDLEKRLTKSLADNRELENALNDFKDRTNGLQAQLAEFSNQKVKIDSELTEVKQRAATAVAETQREIEARNKLTAELNGIISEQKERIGLLQERLEQATGQKEKIDGDYRTFKQTHEALVDKLKKQIDNQEITIHEFREKITVSLVDAILFKPGRSWVNQGGQDALRQIAEIIKDIKEKKILVVGHTDDVPIQSEYRQIFPSNWDLSAARAASVVRFFEEMGVPPTKMEVVGRSLYDPVAPNDSPENRARNRRVEIIIGAGETLSGSPPGK